MKTKTLFLSSFLLCCFSLSACGSSGIYGRYSLQMGKTRGTHFVIAATLGQTTSPYDATKKTFTFTYSSVNAPSSSTTVSSASSNETSSAGSSASSGDNQSILDSLFPINGAWGLAEDGKTIEMDIWFSKEEIEEAMSGMSLSETSSKTSSFASAISSASSGSSAVVSSASAASSGDTPTPVGPLSIPYSFTKYFLKFSLGDKKLAVILPVSVNDALTAIEAYFDGTPADQVEINTVTIELTKE